MNHMVRLKKLTFNIHSRIGFGNQIDLLSNENVQNTFSNFEHSQVISCVDYFSEVGDGQCHIYSYPYTSKNYNMITNSFPGGLLKCVREISLFDERPFEHEFFLRISQSFPLMEKLTLVSQKPQKNKQCRKSKDDQQDFPVIIYPHLNDLDLNEVHDDYMEQFLVHAKTYLPYNVDFVTDHRLLEKVTHNFKRDITRINCPKINYWYSDAISQLPKHFNDYYIQLLFK